MTNSQKITQIQQEIAVLKSKMHEYYPGHLSSEDIEDVSDQYQEMLEYNEYCDEQREIISALQEDIVALQSLHPSHTYNDPAIAEIEWPINNVPEICWCSSCGDLMEIPAQHWSVQNGDLVIANKAICNDCAWEQMADDDTSHSIFESSTYHHMDEYPVGSDGLRYVSAEVGYVDQDEEYR